MAEKEKDVADEAERDETPDKPAAGDASDDDAPVKARGDADDADSDSERDDGDEEQRAARVAEALGVGEQEEAPAEGDDADAKAEEAPQNRAARRRDEALERRRKRKGLPEKKADELPKDKNKRAKELLLRRREAAAEQRPAQLEAGEMVDDALARGWASTTKWLRKNVQVVQWVVALGLIGVAGFVGYTYFTGKKLGGASSLLASGAMAEAAYVMPEDKRPEDEREVDPTLVFKTPEERDEKALAAYREVAQKHPDTGAAILAKLGEAGVLLDKRDWDGAITAFDAVLKTPLAAADADVKGRAIEGIALAKEGKGDADGALAEYRRLETIDAKGYKELSQYHQARVLLTKNTEEDRAKAKDLLKAAYDKLKEPSLDKKGSRYLEQAIEAQLRVLDPSLVPDRQSLTGVRGGQMTAEELQAYQRKLLEELSKKKGSGDEHGDEH